MPKFFYTVVVAALIAWTGVFLVGSSTAPISTGSILFFMLTLFVALGITFTLVAFVYFNYRASLFMNRRILFRRSLKYGYFAGFFVTGILTLRAFDLDTAINYILFTILCAVLYKQFRSSRV
jgi:hypothetical protein